jgi:uncharacterized membrane protein (UPF0127 family)
MSTRPAATAWELTVVRTQHLLASRAVWAGSLRARMVGLLGRADLSEGEGLILAPCQAVHMWFMRFAIDVVFVDRAWRVLALCAPLRPWQCSSWVRGAWAAVEVPTGSVAQAQVAVGDTLLIRPVTEGSR